MKLVGGSAGAIAVEDERAGDPAVMLVHGMAGDATFWDDVVAALGTTHRLIIPELRGHGRSAVPDSGDYSIEANASDLLMVLDALEVERVVLVGHSFGASVVMEMAARAPARVAGLVVVDGAGDFTHVPPVALSAFLEGLASDHDYAATVEGAVDVALVGARADTERRVRAAILAASRPLVRSIYHALLTYRPTVALDAYPGPVLLVTAPVNSASFALHALRPLLPRQSMAGVSHWIIMDEPAVFARVLDDFLDRTVTRA